MKRLFDENKRRNVISLNGLWQFTADRENKGIKDHWAKNLPKGCMEVPVPSLWTCIPGYASYEGVAWYFRHFDGAGFAALEFEAVTGAADVFVDGIHQLSHHGSFTDFSVLLPNLAAGKHFLAVRVDNRHRESDTISLPGGDWYQHGGIPGEVFICRHQDARIQYVRIKYQLSPKRRRTAGAQIQMEIGLVVAKGKRVTRHILVCMNGKQMTETAADFEGATNVHLTFAARHLKLWSPEEPALYRFDVETEDDGLAEMTGFRTVECQDGQLLLNGDPLFLKGFSRRAEPPDFGPALPLDIQYKDISTIKAMGCNAIRGSHYPHAQTFLDLCDCEGMLFWEEIPLWGFPETVRMEPEAVERGLMVYREIIERDVNHPGVILCGLHNENESRPQAAYTVTKAFAGLHRELDGSRPLTYTSVYCLEDICFPLVDVVGLNRYFGRQCEDTQSWGSFLEKFYKKLDSEGIGDKPVILSGFGADGAPDAENFGSRKWIEGRPYEYPDYTPGLFMGDKRIIGTCIGHNTRPIQRNQAGRI